MLVGTINWCSLSLSLFQITYYHVIHYTDEEIQQLYCVILREEFRHSLSTLTLAVHRLCGTF